MKTMQPVSAPAIDLEAAIQLIDVITRESKRMKSESARRELLQAGLRIADLAIAAQAETRVASAA